MPSVQAGLNDNMLWGSRYVGGGSSTFSSVGLGEGYYDGTPHATTVNTQMGDDVNVLYGETHLELIVNRTTTHFKVVLPSENDVYPTLKSQACRPVIGHTYLFL